MHAGPSPAEPPAGRAHPGDPLLASRCDGPPQPAGVWDAGEGEGVAQAWTEPPPHGGRASSQRLQGVVSHASCGGGVHCVPYEQGRQTPLVLPFVPHLYEGRVRGARSVGLAPAAAAASAARQQRQCGIGLKGNKCPKGDETGDLGDGTASAVGVGCGGRNSIEDDCTCMEMCGLHVPTCLTPKLLLSATPKHAKAVAVCNTQTTRTCQLTSPISAPEASSVPVLAAESQAARPTPTARWQHTPGGQARSRGHRPPGRHPHFRATTVRPHFRRWRRPVARPGGRAPLMQRWLCQARVWAGPHCVRGVKRWRKVWLRWTHAWVRPHCTVWARGGGGRVVEKEGSRRVPIPDPPSILLSAVQQQAGNTRDIGAGGCNKRSAAAAAATASSALAAPAPTMVNAAEAPPPQRTVTSAVSAAALAAAAASASHASVTPSSVTSHPSVKSTSGNENRYEPYGAHSSAGACRGLKRVPPMMRMCGLVADRKRCCWESSAGDAVAHGGPTHSHAAPTPATADQPRDTASAVAVFGVSGADDSRPEKYMCGASAEGAEGVRAGPAREAWPCSQRSAEVPRGSGTSIRTQPLRTHDSCGALAVSAASRSATASARLATGGSVRVSTTATGDEEASSPAASAAFSEAEWCMRHVWMHVGCVDACGTCGCVWRVCMYERTRQ
eukprot:366561-Chlamydomonas_euryale.AAC.1